MYKIETFLGEDRLPIIEKKKFASTVLFLKKVFPENLVPVPLKSKLRKIS